MVWDWSTNFVLYVYLYMALKATVSATEIYNKSFKKGFEIEAWILFFAYIPLTLDVINSAVEI